MKISSRGPRETAAVQESGVSQRCGAWTGPAGAGVRAALSRAVQCPQTAVMTVVAACRCGHSATGDRCAAHGPAARPSVCEECAAEGHECPVEVVQIT